MIITAKYGSHHFTGYGENAILTIFPFIAFCCPRNQTRRQTIKCNFFISCPQSSPYDQKCIIRVFNKSFCKRPEDSLRRSIFYHLYSFKCKKKTFEMSRKWLKAVILASSLLLKQTLHNCSQIHFWNAPYWYTGKILVYGRSKCLSGLISQSRREVFNFEKRKKSQWGRSGE